MRLKSMPDVGLTDFTSPLPANARVVIKYTIEVEGLPVYTETYDADKIARELEDDAETVERNWLRRIRCVVGCRSREGFSSCLTRCLADGQCCTMGHLDCAAAENSSDLRQRRAMLRSPRATR
jgi:hypothetical protein